MSDETNGNAKSRLDRIEGILETLVTAAVDLQQEQKSLLRSQVLLQDELRSFGAKAEQRFTRIETNLAEVGDKLNAVVDLMDRHLKEHRN